MPIGNTSFTGQKDPMKRAQSIYKVLEDSSIDAIFIDNKDTKKEVNRTFVEMVIEDFSMLTQNQALFNKFLQIDTKLEKSLREYQAELKSLLHSILGTTVAEPASALNQPIPVGQPTQAVEPLQMQAPSQTIPPKSVGIE